MSAKELTPIAHKDYDVRYAGEGGLIYSKGAFEFVPAPKPIEPIPLKPWQKAVEALTVVPFVFLPLAHIGHIGPDQPGANSLPLPDWQPHLVPHLDLSPQNLLAYLPQSIDIDPEQLVREGASWAIKAALAPLSAVGCNVQPTEQPTPVKPKSPTISPTPYETPIPLSSYAEIPVPDIGGADTNIDKIKADVKSLGDKAALFAKERGIKLVAAKSDVVAVESGLRIIATVVKSPDSKATPSSDTSIGGQVLIEKDGSITRLKDVKNEGFVWRVNSKGETVLYDIDDKNQEWGKLTPEGKVVYVPSGKITAKEGVRGYDIDGVQNVSFLTKQRIKVLGIEKDSRGKPVSYIVEVNPSTEARVRIVSSDTSDYFQVTDNLKSLLEKSTAFPADFVLEEISGLTPFYKMNAETGNLSYGYYRNKDGKTIVYKLTQEDKWYNEHNSHMVWQWEKMNAQDKDTALRFIFSHINTTYKAFTDEQVNWIITAMTTWVPRVTDFSLPPEVASYWEWGDELNSTTIYEALSRLKNISHAPGASFASPTNGTISITDDVVFFNRSDIPNLSYTAKLAMTAEPIVKEATGNYYAQNRRIPNVCGTTKTITDWERYSMTFGYVFYKNAAPFISDSYWRTVLIPQQIGWIKTPPPCGK